MGPAKKGTRHSEEGVQTQSVVLTTSSDGGTEERMTVQDGCVMPARCGCLVMVFLVEGSQGTCISIVYVVHCSNLTKKKRL